MAVPAATEQDLYSHLAIGNYIAQDAKVGLRLVISKEDLRQELVMACYIVKGLYRAYCKVAIVLNTLMDWVEDNQDSLLQSIVKSQLATALAHDVSTLLGRYLNVYVRALCTAGLKVPGFKTECSLEHIFSNILC